jgi:hypothetical protein
VRDSSTHDSELRDANRPGVESGCATASVGGPCSPEGLGCTLPGCEMALCSGGMWVGEPLCVEEAGVPVDSGHDSGSGRLDGGSTSVTSCDKCSAGAMCVVSITQGGACFPAQEGGTGDGGCANGATGECCNTFTVFSCESLPASCSGKVTCGCASQACGSGHRCVNGSVDAGTSGLVLVCEEDVP